MLINMALIVIGGLADYASTRYGLSHGLSEMNPIITYAGLEEVKLLSTIAMCGIVSTAPRRTARTSALVAGGVLGLATLNNLYHIAVHATK
jgi:hypothetical protein